MKTITKALLTTTLCLLLTPTHAQPGRSGMGPMGATPRGPDLGGSMAKIFGDNSAFTATLEMQNKGSSGATTTVPGKIAALDGKSRFQIEMTQMKGADRPPQDNAQMKAMGINMDTMVMISRPDKKTTYLVLPGMQSYVENAIQDPEASKPASDFKVETTELGKETVDGHPCVKNKMIVTDDQGKKHESLVWNATDLKNFPVKIETTENGSTSTMLFKDVKLGKPDVAQFDPPADFKKYDNMMELMRETVMKHMGGPRGMQGAPGGE